MKRIQEPPKVDLHGNGMMQRGFLASSFIIFSMQTGFGMLESGIVSLKNEINIMMKNVVDVVLGGMTYWAFGYGLSYGDSEYSNGFISFGNWFVDSEPGENMGPTFVTFLFQLSFATTATTIVSGAMAERCNFHAYCLFSLVNTVVYCLPAGWVWGNKGFLRQMGVVDIGGSGPVHLVGGSSAFIASWMLGPRLGRWDLDGMPPMGSPTNALTGLFMLWWGWLAFNSGSTFGVTGNKWRLAAKATCTTMASSFAGGLVALVMSFIIHKRKIDVMSTINGILGSLVGVTASCAVITIWEAFIIGAIGAFLAIATDPLLILLKIDDAVGATSVHGFCGAWGVIAVGIFGKRDIIGTYLSWAMIVTYILLFLVNIVIPIRMTEYEEILGADFCEHDIRHSGVGVSRAVSVLQHYDPNIDPTIEPAGHNKGHDEILYDKFEKKLKSVRGEGSRAVSKIWKNIRPKNQVEVSLE
ncbi:amt [Lepeophtheirus salmonis]|uniref:Amt n=1 Tax=Lepeophtheirus salmonis TaxID=72036 RepID=A0A7R8CP97_LEPSM|nr:amt [Lepeophtheirus salmonis]CAF2881568.1 amt [Lepeophtheirus salmonis]